MESIFRWNSVVKKGGVLTHDEYKEHRCQVTRTADVSSTVLFQELDPSTCSYLYGQMIYSYVEID